MEIQMAMWARQDCFGDWCSCRRSAPSVKRIRACRSSVAPSPAQRRVEFGEDRCPGHEIGLEEHDSTLVSGNALKQAPGSG
jgi:hypothetical protein